MKRVWKPLDVGGLRLYVVKSRWIILGKEYPLDDTIVAANSPRHAASLIETIHKDSRHHEDGSFICIGKALDIYMPEKWWQDGVLCETN